MISFTPAESARRLAALLTPASGGVHDPVTTIVPPRHNRYLRIFNPAWRDAESVPTARWRDIAEEAGEVLRPDAQWNRDLLTLPGVSARYGDPVLGEPDAALLSALGQILLRREPAPRAWSFATSSVYGVRGAPADAQVRFPHGGEMVVFGGSVRSVTGDFLLPALTDGRLPMYMWPPDLEWVMGQALYGRSVYLACSFEVAEAVTADPRLEVMDVNSWDVAEHED